MHLKSLKQAAVGGSRVFLVDLVGVIYEGVFVVKELLPRVLGFCYILLAFPDQSAGWGDREMEFV